MKLSLLAVTLAYLVVSPTALGGVVPNLAPEGSKSGGDTELLVPKEDIPSKVAADPVPQNAKLPEGAECDKGAPAPGRGHHRRRNLHRSRQALCLAPVTLEKHLKHVMHSYQKHLGLTDDTRDALSKKITTTYMSFVQAEGYSLHQGPIEFEDDVLEEEDGVMAIPETNLRQPDDQADAQAREATASSDDTPVSGDDTTEAFDHEFYCIPVKSIRKHILAAVRHHTKDLSIDEKKRTKVQAMIAKDFVIQVMRNGFILREPVKGHGRNSDGKDDTTSKGPTVIIIDKAPPKGSVPHEPRFPDYEKPAIIVDPVPPMHRPVFHWKSHHFLALTGMFLGSFLLGYFGTKMVTSCADRKRRSQGGDYEQLPIMSPSEKNDATIMEVKIVRALEETLGAS